MCRTPATGSVGGFPVVDVRVTVFDGKHHSVDSSEMAFRIAGALAMKEALASAGSVVLEPIMEVSVTVPDEAVGDVMGDLSGRRGRPLGMESRGQNQVVRAEVPMAEMLTYAPDLRAMTAGRGDYSMEFLKYEAMPSHHSIAQFRRILGDELRLSSTLTVRDVWTVSTTLCLPPR